MAEAPHERAAPHPEAPPPAVHVDTPEQAAARQLVETSQRVTHVAGAAPPPPSGGRPHAEKEDFSLQALAAPEEPKSESHATKGKS